MDDDFNEFVKKQVENNKEYENDIITNNPKIQIINLLAEKTGELTSIIKKAKNVNNNLGNDIFYSVINTILLSCSNDFDEIYKIIDVVKKSLIEKEKEFNKNDILFSKEK